jgi:hypothetical protein
VGFHQRSRYKLTSSLNHQRRGLSLEEQVQSNNQPLPSEKRAFIRGAGTVWPPASTIREVGLQQRSRYDLTSSLNHQRSRLSSEEQVQSDLQPLPSEEQALSDLQPHQPEEQARSDLQPLRRNS